MRVIYKQAVQAHAVPASILEARGPFGKYEPQKAVETPVEEFPIGATAQNGMAEVAMYECSACSAIIREGDLDSHECRE